MVERSTRPETQARCLPSLHPALRAARELPRRHLCGADDGRAAGRRRGRIRCDGRGGADVAVWGGYKTVVMRGGSCGL
eukprot:162452-Chlamydomonas_euryale.AAC.2